jgi:hypothetical protein
MLSNLFHCYLLQVCEDVFDKVLAEVADKVDVLVAYMGE